MARFSAFWRLILALSLTLGGISGPRQSHAANLKSFSVQYEISIAFVSIGTARLSETRRGAGYKLHFGADFTGLFRYFFAPKLATDAEGSEANGKLLSNRYSFVVDHPDDPQRVDMTLSGGSVTNVVLDPPLRERADRVPVLPEHKRGIVDPLTAFMVPQKGEAASGEVCPQTLKIFDGAGRFDISLLPDQERTLAIPGYKGPSIDCFVRYVPVSGHREKRANVTYMENNRDISVRLIPVPGQPYFIPAVIQVATLIGNLRIEAVKVEGFEKPSETTSAEAE